MTMDRSLCSLGDERCRDDADLLRYLPIALTEPSYPLKLWLPPPTIQYRHLPRSVSHVPSLPNIITDP
jgi:hypothetical protein